MAKYTRHHPSAFLLVVILSMALCRVEADPLITNIGIIPVGRSFHGVKFPSYNDELELQSVMEADTITRTTQTYFDITNLKVQIFVDNKVRTTIEMEEAIYHIPSNTLKSKKTKKKPKVIDFDFIMTGDQLTANIITQVTKMDGNVRVAVSYTHLTLPTTPYV